MAPLFVRGFLYLGLSSRGQRNPLAGEEKAKWSHANGLQVGGLAGLCVSLEARGTTMPDEHTTPVPPGLTRCPVCGEYRGSTLAQHLTWNEPLGSSELNEVIEVRCICGGGPCRRCGKMMRRPISDYYDERTNSIIHVPYFVGMFPCRECRSRERREQ